MNIPNHCYESTQLPELTRSTDAGANADAVAIQIAERATESFIVNVYSEN